MTGEHEPIPAAVPPVEEPDAHEELETIGRRTNAMKIVAGVIVALLGIGFGTALWVGNLETRASAVAREASLRGDFQRRSDDCEKRIRELEEWRSACDERDRWMLRALDAIGHKLNAPLDPPPVVQVRR